MESLLTALARRGPDGSGVLGMFALLVWDRHRGVVLAARDPLGIKPLYWRYVTAGLPAGLGQRAPVLAFASTMGALTGLPGDDPPRPFPAGCTAVFPVAVPGPVAPQAYYRLPSNRLPSNPTEDRTAADASEALVAVGEALERAVRRRLVADVPMGVFLSGGLDSSLVLTGEGADEVFAGYESLAPLSGKPLKAELCRLLADLQGSNLQRVDRMTMAWGLEARVPFLDVELLERAFSLDPSLLRGPAGEVKWPLRRLAAGLLPAEAVRAPKDKFSQGTGVARVLAAAAAAAVGEKEWEWARRDWRLPPAARASREAYWYYRCFRAAFGEAAEGIPVTLSRSVVALSLKHNSHPTRQ
ncbi:MAG: hypothetical protein IRY95_10455, partial [Clostridia bacterium]|nr:hypothetical protein [Clostridia bacterium]